MNRKPCGRLIQCKPCGRLIQRYVGRYVGIRSIPHSYTYAIGNILEQLCFTCLIWANSIESGARVRLHYSRAEEPMGAYYVTYPWWIRLREWLANRIKPDPRHGRYATLDGKPVSNPFGKRRR